jgi:nitrite reductase/ring-hydroxylating ferredoxin subunit
LLCALSDLADPGAKGFVFRQDEALFLGFIVRRGDRVLGYIDHCPHAGWPLAGQPDRYLTKAGDKIICSAHGALFEPSTGICTSGPCAGHALSAWPVRMDGPNVIVA